MNGGCADQDVFTVEQAHHHIAALLPQAVILNAGTQREQIALGSAEVEDAIAAAGEHKAIRSGATPQPVVAFSAIKPVVSGS